MLPRKLHLDQINRFHDAYININEQIDNETDKQKLYELLKTNIKIIRLWNKVDNFIELTLKQKLDEL